LHTYDHRIAAACLFLRVSPVPLHVRRLRVAGER
jgi:hypothetical protein